MVRGMEVAEGDSRICQGGEARALVSEAYEGMATLVQPRRMERQTTATAEDVFGSLTLVDPSSDGGSGRQVEAAGRDAAFCGNPQTERARLCELAQAQLSPERLSRFQEDVAAFERRACASGLPPREVAATLRAVSRLMETCGGEPIDAAQRMRLAEQVMHQAAVPTDVNQGGRSTCSVAALEGMLYSRNPSRAAEMVTAIATTGEFQLRYPAGEEVPNPPPVVRLHPASLVPDADASADPLPDGRRSYASQIFQLTAANVHYAMTNAVRGSQIWYVQGDVTPGSSPPVTGERVMDFSQNPPRQMTDRDGRAIDYPDLSDSAVVSVANHILGDRSTIFLRHADRNSPKDPDDGQQLISAATPEQMAARLSELRALGRLPAMVIVNADHPPFVPEGKPPGSTSAWHILTVSDFDPVSGRVSLDNQWGRDEDLTGPRALSLEDFMRVTGDPDATQPDFDAMRQEIGRNRAAGRSDYLSELDYLQQQMQYHRISQAQYEQQAAHVLAQLLHARGARSADSWEQVMNREEQRRIRRVLFQLHEGPGESKDRRGTAVLRLASEELLRMPEAIDCSPTD